MKFSTTKMKELKMWQNHFIREITICDSQLDKYRKRRAYYTDKLDIINNLIEG